MPELWTLGHLARFDMKEAIISGLALAAISGATFVAYNHPAAYYSAARRIGWVLLAIFIGSFLFMFSGSIYLIALTPHLAFPDAKRIIDDFDKSMQKDISLVWAVLIGLMVFGSFLSWVAKLKHTPGKE